jgi:2-hydroxychromene-2-carboxylate isomerase
MSEQKKVKFYFAYNSPYAFLANTHIEQELAPLGVSLEYKPVYSPRRGSGPDPNSPKLKYMFADVRRFAEAYGLHLNLGPFADSKKACLGFFFAQEKGCGKAYHDGVYNARWLEGKDIGQEEMLAGIVESCGLGRQEFLSALQDARYEAALEESNKAAEVDEVFGFPFFIYEGQKFWGNDRIEWLVRAIQGG